MEAAERHKSDTLRESLDKIAGEPGVLPGFSAVEKKDKGELSHGKTV